MMPEQARRERYKGDQHQKQTVHPEHAAIDRVKIEDERVMGNPPYVADHEADDIDSQVRPKVPDRFEHRSIADARTQVRNMNFENKKRDRKGDDAVAKCLQSVFWQSVHPS